MFFLLWLLSVTLLHLALAFLWADYKRNWSGEFPFDEILDEVRLSWSFIRRRFVQDAFWIEAAHVGFDEVPPTHEDEELGLDTAFHIDTVPGGEV